MIIRGFFSLFFTFLLISVLGNNLADSSYILITNVNVWDGLSDTILPNQQVLIEGNRIRQISSGINMTGRTKVIDGKGNTLIPGLSDAHVHLMYTMPMDKVYNTAHWSYMGARAAKMAENFLMEGFTTVRDMGGPVFGLKQAIDEGSVAGPRIYPCGALISQTSGRGDVRNLNDMNPRWNGNNMNLFQMQGWAYLADGGPEVLRAVRENLRNGACQIKMVAGGAMPTGPLHSVQFTKEELQAGVQAASDWGTYVAVHVYNPEGIMRALEAGVKVIEHGHMINDTAMHLLKEKDAFLVPQCYWVMEETAFSKHPDNFKKLQESVDCQMELAKKYGVKVAYGTDAHGDLGVESNALKEFIARTRWYTPVEILRQATSQNAELFALSGELNPYPDGSIGVIREGAYADLLIYDGNPLEDIQVIVDFKDHLKFIMKDGKIYKDEL